MEETGLAMQRTDSHAEAARSERRRGSFYTKHTWQLHALVLPAALFIIVFQYVPMFGIVMAFQDYKPWLGFWNSPWVGWEHFKYMFYTSNSRQVIGNTFFLGTFKVLTGFVVPILFALLLNEVRRLFFKRFVQTLVYLPYFLSWVVLGGILIDLLSINDYGLVNQFLGLFGISPIFFLGDGNWFRFTLIVSDIWKDFGFSAIVFLAALTGINPALYEAAEIDGASRWKQTIHITIPGIVPVSVVVLVLSLGGVVNGQLDQVLNLYNSLVYDKGDVIDTFVYRTGLLNANFSFATAIGLFKSAVAFVLVVSSYALAHKIANYKIF